MNEAEWLGCTDPEAMLDFLRGKTSDRKMRLYACADCRRVWHWFDHDESSQAAIGVAERYADEQATSDDLLVANQLPGLSGSVAYLTTVADAVEGAWGTAHCIADGASQCGNIEDVEPTLRAEQVAQAALVRDIFGNPLRPVEVRPEWRTDSVVSLARQMYESRDFGGMPTLASMLREAGCDSDAILVHCRGPSPHVRGCWVVDLLLGKG